MGMTGMGMTQQAARMEAVEPAVIAVSAAPMPVQEPMPAAVAARGKKNQKLVTKKTRKDCC